MKGIIKVLAVFVVLIILVGVGLTAFVRFYLTDERLNALIVPQAEKALGRQVSLGNIDVSLFKGITLNDFSVKEEDQKTDFLYVKGFVLRYELMPLLQKNLIVSEILLNEPQIRVSRDKSGKFNFNSLAVLTPDKAEKKPAAPSSSAAAIPVALTVDTIKVNNARIIVQDALGEIPDIDTQADLSVSVGIGKDLASLRYDGTLQFVSNAVYQGLKPQTSGKIDFDQKQISFEVDVTLDKEKARLSGAVLDYTGKPDITLNVSSDNLQIDHLLAMVAGLGGQVQKAGQEVKKDQGKSKKAIGTQIPEGLKAHGAVRVKEAVYKNLPVRDFQLDYSLVNNILSVSRLTAKTAGGEIHKKLELDLNHVDPTYKGKVDIKALQLAELQAALFPKIPERLLGAFSTSLTFSGSGMEWPSLADKLNMVGDYSLRKGQLQNVDIARVIAEAVGVGALKDILVDDLSGNAEIRDGKMHLKYKMNGRDVTLTSKEGIISLDGSAVDMPFHLTFSPEISEKLKQKNALANYLADEKGQTSISLKVKGSVRKPRVALDSSGVQKQATETLKKKAFEELDRALGSEQKETGKPDPAAVGRELLKGFFGQ
ncbi:MAG: AsmA family protein [Desulfobulbaceae bacterium]|uniref:AsmA family protein n=1 Tax=Candidatus Desulfobia pelagia TaxID=2841692 RepID=A0A8J6NCZ9_9BACT|nr:AsmA family protein [Candidatus Desulfobia pelagia]